MKMIRTLMGVFVVALLAATAPSQASADAIDDAKDILRGDGALVMDYDYIEQVYGEYIPQTPIPWRFLAMQTVPCLGNLTEPLCSNYANTAVTYAGFLWPGRPVDTPVPIEGVPPEHWPILPLPTCTPAAPAAVPFPPGAPLPSPVCRSVQISTDEAIVIYGLVPPDSPYWGLEFNVQERHPDSIENYPDDVQPLKPAENPPPPVSPGRVVTGNASGDTENKLVLTFGENPDSTPEDPKPDVFAIIYSGNMDTAEMVRAALEDALIPPEAIFVKELPPEYVLRPDHVADNFRLVLRLAEPIPQGELAAWLRPNAPQGDFFTPPLEPFRVTVPGIHHTPYGPITHIDRSTGVDQKEGTCNIADKWEKYVKSKYGKPDVETIMTPRRYDDEFCFETGTYCWGNNNDALYLNAMTKKEDAMYVYDLSGSDSRVVLAGIDHVATGHSLVWNWDIYDGEYDPTDPEPGESGGRAYETYLFSDAQDDDYTADFDEFCGQNPSNCACGYPESECGNWTDKRCAKDPEGCAAAVEHCRTNYPNPLDGKLYWAQLRQFCAPEDPHCRELCAAFEVGTPESVVCRGDAPKREIMNRVYLSPTTMTGPDWDETRHTRIYGYE